MIICGIIQSPDNNNDQLLVHQISGEHQNSNAIINAQIKLTSTGKCINSKEINAWYIHTRGELYVQVVTNSSDFLGRPIILGIYIKKEDDDSKEISQETIVELLNSFLLKMDDASIANVTSFIVNHYTKAFLRGCLIRSCIIGIVLVLIVALFSYSIT